MSHYGVDPLPGLPARVTICEVGPGDGLQNEAELVPPEIKVEFVERLVDAGHTVVETTSLVHPKWVPQLADAEEVLRRVRRRPGVRYPVLVPSQRGLDRALDLGGLGGCPYAKSATGNLATEDLLWQLDGLGISTGVNLPKLAETSAWLARQLGRPSPSRTVRALEGELRD